MKSYNLYPLYLFIILLSILSVSGTFASPPLGTDSSWVEYTALPDPITPGSFEFAQEIPITIICEQFSTPYSSISTYVANHGIYTVGGGDLDHVIGYYQYPDYTVITTGDWQEWDNSLQVTFPATNFSMNTPGLYLAQAKWDDNPAISSRNDEPVYAYFTVRLWVPETTYFRQPNFTNCTILYNGQSILGQNLWCQFTAAQLISKYLDGMGIDYTDGYDEDERQIKWYNVFGNETISIDTVVDNIGGYWQAAMVSTAGVYPATAQWYDGGPPSYFDDGTTTRSFTLHLWIPVTTYHQPPNLLPGDIIRNGQSIVTTQLWRQFTGSQLLTEYLEDMEITLTYGYDSDERHITTFDIYGNPTVAINTVADNYSGSWQNYFVNTTGIYTVTANWNDTGTPNYYDDGSTLKSFTLHLWVPETTYIVQPLMQPGHIYQNGTMVDDSTFYEPVHPQTDTTQPPPYHLYDWLSDNHISAGYGCDSDSQVVVTYAENGQPSASTTRYPNDTYYYPPGNFYLTTPGVYTLTWTFKDTPGMADDPDATRSITIVVFKVEISQPTSWPQSMAVKNTLPLTATVTPPEAINPAISGYSWSLDSQTEGCKGEFTPLISADINTTLFTAGLGEGDGYIHVEYIRAGKVAKSTPKKIIIFNMKILDINFTGDHTIQCNTTIISDTAWSGETNPARNDPVCYTKNNAITMTGKFAISTTLPLPVTVYIKADDSGSNTFDALKTASISAMTTNISGITSSGTLPNYVCITTINYYWKFSTDGTNWRYIDNVNFPALGYTGPHKIYVTLATPQAPMATPWTEVLDKACVWAAEATSSSLAVDSITRGAYWNIGKNYTPNDTHASWIEHVFHLKKFLNDNWADCQDMSATVQVFNNALGVSNISVRRIVGPFGYKPIDPVGNPSWDDGAWSFHQVGWYDGYVYDACVRLAYNDDTNNTRVPVREDMDVSYKNDLFAITIPPGTWNPQTPYNYTEVDAKLTW
ncbi:MAG: hypothetical protein ACE14V_13345 [bacterium]